MNNFLMALLAPISFLLTSLLGKQFEWKDLGFAVICYFMTLGIYYTVEWFTK